MRNITHGLLSFLLLVPLAASAELVVIVNPASGVEVLTKSDVINVFMGRFQKLPSGISAFPVDYASEREHFYKRLVDKPPAEINSYWARLVFSGRASPPRQIDNLEELLDIVRNNKGAIGYLDRSMTDASVRVVYAFGN